MCIRDRDWIDIIDLETERLLEQEDFMLAEADVMDQFEQARDLPADDAMALLEDVPLINRDHTALIDLAHDIIDEDPLDPIADIARLYAAYALSDPMSAQPQERPANEVLLDTVANTDNPDIHAQAISMLMDISPGHLQQEDITLLEHSWFMIDERDRSQLSRFLVSHHFEEGSLSDAQIWTDRLEAEVLSGDASPQHQVAFLKDVQHARARIGARLDTEPESWDVAVEQAAWQLSLIHI